MKSALLSSISLMLTEVTDTDAKDCVEYSRCRKGVSDPCHYEFLVLEATI